MFYLVLIVPNSKKKGKNCSKSEEGTLIDQIANKREVIESKATNRKSRNSNPKNQTWKEVVTFYYNNLRVNQRSIEQLNSKRGQPEESHRKLPLDFKADWILSFGQNIKYN